MERFRCSLLTKIQVVLLLLFFAVCIGASAQQAIAVSLDYSAAGKVTDAKMLHMS